MSQLTALFTPFVRTLDEIQSADRIKSLNKIDFDSKNLVVVDARYVFDKIVFAAYTLRNKVTQHTQKKSEHSPSAGYVDLKTFFNPQTTILTAFK